MSTDLSPNCVFFHCEKQKHENLISSWEPPTGSTKLLTAAVIPGLAPEPAASASPSQSETAGEASRWVMHAWIRKVLELSL